jgi:hypothetical protein
MRPALLAVLVVLVGGCSSVSVVRLSPESVEVGPGMRPIAGVQAEVTSFNLLFIPIPGGVSLDRVLNRMLLVAARNLGADKVVDVTFAVECPNVCLSRFFGFTSARATGIAVQLTGAVPDAEPEAQPPK